MTSTDFDVIIVGGGPSGVMCSITLAKKGHSVVILDKKSRNLIGDKTCGDALDLESVKLINEKLNIEFPNGSELSDEIQRMKIAAETLDTASTLTAPGFLVDRLKYAQRLLEEAQNLGVTIIPNAAVRDVVIEDQTMKGVVYVNKRTKETVTLHSKFVVDASGAYAVIRKKLPKEMNYLDCIENELHPDMVWPTYREIIQISKELPDHLYRNEIILLYEEDIPVPGYFWVFSKGDHQLNFGIGWLKSETNMGKLKEILHKKMHEYYPEGSYKVIKAGGGQIPIRPPFDNEVFNGGILIGDAGCFVHPTTAEGHGPALETGYYAGMAISHAISISSVSYKDLWQFNVNAMRSVALLHAKGYLIRLFIEKLGVQNLKFLIQRQFITDREFDDIVRGRQMIIGFGSKLKKIIKIFPKFGLLNHVSWMQSKFEKVDELYSNYPESPEQLGEWIKKRNRLLDFNFQ